MSQQQTISRSEQGQEIEYICQLHVLLWEEQFYHKKGES